MTATEARNVQRKALLWLVVSIIQVLFFTFCMGIPSVQADLAAEPLYIVPCLPFLIGALAYILYGYNHDYRLAEDVIRGRHKRS